MQQMSKIEFITGDFILPMRCQTPGSLLKTVIWDLLDLISSEIGYIKYRDFCEGHHPYYHSKFFINITSLVRPRTRGLYITVIDLRNVHTSNLRLLMVEDFFMSIVNMQIYSKVSNLCMRFGTNSVCIYRKRFVKTYYTAMSVKCRHLAKPCQWRPHTTVVSVSGSN